MTEAPILTTARLTLRSHAMSDWPDLRDMLASDRARHIGGPLDERAAWSFFARAVAPWSLQGHGAFAIDVADTGTFVGQISLARPPWFPETELGWLMLPAAEGRGFAAEAAGAVRDWAFANTALDGLVSYIHVDNTRSIALAERLRARPDPDATAPYINHVVYRHPGPEAVQ